MHPIVRLEKVSRCFGKVRALDELSHELANEEVCFQPGLEAGAITLFEAWHCLPLDSAAVGGAGAARAAVRS